MGNIVKIQEIDFEKWIESEECNNSVQGYLELNEVALEDLSQLNFKIYGALKRAQLDFVHQIFSMSIMELSAITGIDETIAKNIRMQIMEYLKMHRDEILRYNSIHSNDDISDHLEMGTRKELIEKGVKNEEDQKDLFYKNNKEKVLEFVKANDIPIEKMFSNRLVNYLHSRYKKLSDLIFVDDDVLRVECRLNKYYVQKVRTRVNQYLEQHHTLIVAYCNDDYNTINHNVNVDLISNSETVDISVIPSNKNDNITNEYYIVGGQPLSVFNLTGIEEYKIKILEFAKANDVSLDQLGLSNRSNNCLHRAGYSFLSDIIFETEESLSLFRHMGKTSIKEVTNVIDDYFLQHQERIAAYCNGDEKALVMQVQIDKANTNMLGIYELIKRPEYIERITDFVRSNDRSVESLNLSARATNCLKKEGYEKLSEFIFETEDSLRNIRNLGTNSLAEILNLIKDYLNKYEDRIICYCQGDTSSIFDQDILKEKIIEVFNNIAFSGLHYSEILEALKLPEEFDDEVIKHIIGQLISEHQLEYVDYRCYRTYSSFESFLLEDTTLTERERNYVFRKMSGETLEEIAKSENITRERVRQVIKKAVNKVHIQYFQKTGLQIFDEDYYQHFYTTYEVDKNVCLDWFGIPEKTYNYISMFNSRGKENIEEAIDDPDLDIGFKLKITNYLNRNKIYVDGNWVEKKRALLEEVVLAKYCKNEVSYDDFCVLYNKFLEDQGISYDKKIYYTEDILESRKNRLSEARCVLWKQSQMLRYYDIDGQDYTDLLESINIEGYKNTEVSTLKMYKDNQELMTRYDIRDHYELHNLIRKIIPEGSYNGFKCGRMPNISFGEFDRESALFDILINNAPISMNDLADLIQEEYGYDKATIMATYLTPFKGYYYQGIYVIDQKVMPNQHMDVLKKLLIDDFYFIEDIKHIYKNVIPDADLETVNPYNLKNMGFNVLSRYVLKNYPSLDAYFNHILTEKELVDITEYRKKYGYIQMWSTKLTRLKSSYDIIEFEPNQIVNFSRLEKAGVTKQLLKEFCDKVYQFVEDGTYFSAKSLRLSGFESELYDLGFSDWFYASVLCADGRFSFNNMFKSLILYKGKMPISINSFVYDYVKRVGSIDTYELMDILENEYDCKLVDRNRFMRGIYGINLYYDPILQRLYLNEELYYKELDNDQEGM